MNRSKRLQGELSCEVCGNNHGSCFEVHLGGERHVFDSFECAMRAFQRRCERCGSEIIGHGIQVGNTMYCSYACANEANVHDYGTRIQLREQSEY